VEQKIRLRHEHYEIEPPIEDAGLISRIEVVFDNFNQMSSAVDHFLGELQDAEALEVNWIENNCRRPTCLGVKDINIGVRISETAEDGSVRWHICEVKISLQYMNYAKHGDMKDRWMVVSDVLQACGVQNHDQEIVCEILLAALDCTLPAAVRRKVCEFDRITRFVNALLKELEDVFKPHDVQGCQELIAEMASQASLAGVPRPLVDRMLRRLAVGPDVEEADWQQAEMERLAKEDAERFAREAADRKVQEEEDRKQREEADALAAAEEEGDREMKEAKAKRFAENEAKKAAKEAEVGAKAAEREAEKQREADLQARAKSVTDEFLASKGLDSVHAFHECGRPALLLAAAEGDGFLVESVLMQGADIRAASSEDGGGAMHHGARADAVDVLEVLLRSGLPVEAQTETGERPMHFAAAAGSTKALEFLKNAGGKVNAKSMSGRSSMFSAAKSNQVDAAEWLLANGGSLDAKDDDGTMLLHVAASHNAGAMVTWLLGKGVDAGVKDGDGKTAKQLAKKNNCKKSLEALPD